MAVAPTEDRFGGLPRFCAGAGAASGSAGASLAAPAAGADWRLLTAMGLLACSRRHSGAVSAGCANRAPQAWTGATLQQHRL